MLTYPGFDPVAVQLGPIAIHWYGVMYLVGFIGGWWLGTRRAERPGSGWTKDDVSDVLFYVAMGVVLGGRLGYVLFYKFGDYLFEPWRIFFVWEGGMSFHGGLLGVITAMWLYARRTQRPFFAVSDFVAPLVTIGLGAGRIGNFINGELWGKATTSPFGMIIPGMSEARYPSQLYEAFLEGFVLFVILWVYSSKSRPLGATSGLFLLCYGSFRILVEFVRVPDEHLGYLAMGWVTMGQILSVPMILLGVFLLWRAYKTKPPTAQTVVT